MLLIVTNTCVCDKNMKHTRGADIDFRLGFVLRKRRREM